MELNYVDRCDDRVAIENILISVADKRELETLIPGLLRLVPDVRFYSTGGTYAKIAAILGERAEKHLVRVADYTGQPEMQGGLVKTLDFKIYLGLLSETYNDDHRGDLRRLEAIEFDMAVVNLYPFGETVADPANTLERARGNIDIGGPCMLRASAKNFLRVASVCDPDDYAAILAELEAGKGTLGLARRFALARKSFAHTAAYDRAIAEYLESAAEAALEKTYATTEGSGA